MQVDKVVPSSDLNKYSIFTSFILESDGPGISNVLLSDCYISTRLLNEFLEFNINISDKFSYKNPPFYQQLYLPSDLSSEHTALFIKMYFNTLLKECKGEYDDLYIYIKHFLLPDYKVPSPTPDQTKSIIRASLSYLSRFPDDISGSFRQSPRRESNCTPPGEISSMDVLRSTMGSRNEIYLAVRAEHLKNSSILSRASFTNQSSLKENELSLRKLSIINSDGDPRMSPLPRHSPVPQFENLSKIQNSAQSSAINSPQMRSSICAPSSGIDDEEPDENQVRTNAAKSIVESPQMRSIYKPRKSIEKVSSPVKKVPTFISVAAITPRNVVTNIVNNSLSSNFSLPFKPSSSNNLFAPIPLSDSPINCESKSPQPKKKSFFFF